MNMKIQCLLGATFITGFVAIASATQHDVPPESRESIEWCDIWISHANETNLPRVLLIGDSITRAYYPEVEKRLAGKAYVARLATSRFPSDPVLAKEIVLVLDGTKFDIIHFNNGMHGWQHSEAEYRKVFPEFLATIQSHAPKAKLIWASTTTLKESKVLAPDALGEASDERIAARNEIALEFVRPKGIAVDDLCALVRGHAEYHSDNVHFNDRGILLQAGQVAGSIGKLLDH
jgi:hypothetical protein